MLEMLMLGLILYALPLIIFLVLARSTHTSRIRFWIHLGFAAALSLILYIWGQYAILGSHYFRYLLPLFLVLTGFMAFRRANFSAPKSLVKMLKKISTLAMAGVALGALYFAVLGISGFGIKEEGIELDFPFKDGRWYVGSGGTSQVINLHYREETPFQMLGVDFHPLNNFLSTKSSVFGNQNEDFVGFGKIVTSPCEGIVLAIRNDVPDNPPGEFLPDIPGSGNRVLLMCGDVKISMYHFQKGSVKVSIGDQVQIGDPLGNIGNSGFTSDPHLHIHASVEDVSVSGGQRGIPMIFKGQFLVRNDIVGK